MSAVTSQTAAGSQRSLQLAIAAARTAAENRGRDIVLVAGGGRVNKEFRAETRSVRIEDLTAHGSGI